tara:strand:+ start:119 stop:412 length:294 start_codon:yes stop_codon:yes gene_type:complete
MLKRYLINKVKNEYSFIKMDCLKQFINEIDLKHFSIMELLTIYNKLYGEKSLNKLNKTFGKLEIPNELFDFKTEYKENFKLTKEEVKEIIKKGLKND